MFSHSKHKEPKEHKERKEHKKHKPITVINEVTIKVNAEEKDSDCATCCKAFWAIFKRK